MRAVRWILLVLLACAGAGLIAILSVSFNAQEPPMPGEVRIVTQVKRWYISRAARSVPPEPPSNLPSVNSGQMTYGGDCSSCHGEDGRHPEPLGQSMFPPAPDLGSAAVQQWSDAELFWIIKHGIRRSGMPGFEKINPDDTIWDLVHYVRSLGASPAEKPPAN
jgi:mono/diheme cytochrome c family protein